jgi:hypothetical protein
VADKVKQHGLAEHMDDVYGWWITTYGRSDPHDREWCKNIAYERWLNDKPLLSTEDPPVPWYTSKVARG